MLCVCPKQHNKIVAYIFFSFHSRKNYFIQNIHYSPEIFIEKYAAAKTIAQIGGSHFVVVGFCCNIIVIISIFRL